MSQPASWSRSPSPSATRSPALPDVPTVAEAGIRGYEANFYLVAMAPRGTPEAVVQKFRTALLEALKAPDVIARLKASDQAVVGYDGAKTGGAGSRLEEMGRDRAQDPTRPGLKDGRG